MVRRHGPHHQIHNVNTASAKQASKAASVTPEATVEAAEAVTGSMAAGLVGDPTLVFDMVSAGEVEPGVGDGFNERAIVADGRAAVKEMPAALHKFCVNSMVSKIGLGNRRTETSHKHTLEIRRAACLLNGRHEGVDEGLVLANACNICDSASGGTEVRNRCLRLFDIGGQSCSPELMMGFTCGTSWNS